MIAIIEFSILLLRPNKYISKLPPKAIEKNVFIVNFVNDSSSGIAGKTNHSIRGSAASSLFSDRRPEFFGFQDYMW